MEAVTGAVRIEARDTKEIERFFREHLESLDGHAITVQVSANGTYIADFYSINEPTSS